jgi:hypothetical protein
VLQIWANLGRTCGHLEPTSDPEGPSWANLGPTWSHVGASLDHIFRFSIGVHNGGGEIRLEGVRAEALEQQKRERQEMGSKPIPLTTKCRKRQETTTQPCFVCFGQAGGPANLHSGIATFRSVCVHVCVCVCAGVRAHACARANMCMCASVCAGAPCCNQS